MQHVAAVAAIDAPRLAKSEFYARVRGGDMFFCAGQALISHAIEAETHSPWSHVGMAWSASWSEQWLTLEATIHKGVHIGLLADYVDRYDGDIVLCRRALTPPQIVAELNKGLSLLDYGYDWQQEVTFAAHKLLHCFPVVKPKDDCYCSALMQIMSTATPYPIQQPGVCAATPEDCWTDPTVTVVGVLAR